VQLEVANNLKEFRVSIDYYKYL
jgi:calcium-dependent protein kinase